MSGSQGMASDSRKAGLGSIFLTVFLDLVGFGIVMPFLALQAREIYGVSEGVATLLGASYSLAQFLFVPFWGRLSDRIGRRPVLLLSIFFTSVSMTGLGLALAYTDQVIWLFLARIFAGIATANIGTASAYIADVTSKEDRVKGMGLIGMAFGLGFIVGPGIGGYFASFPVGGREGPMACFVAGALSLVNLLWVYRSVKESLAKDKQMKSERRLSPMDFSKARDMLRSPFIGRAVSSNFLIILAFSGLEMTYAFYAQDAFQLTMSGVGGMFVFMGFMAALVQGGFVRRYGQKLHDGRLAIAGLVLQAFAFLGLAFAPTLGMAGLIGFSGVLAIGNGLTQPALSGFVSRRTDASGQGSALSTFHSFSALARVFGPALGGALYASFGAKSPFLIGGLINLLGFCLALRLKSSPMPVSEDELGAASAASPG